MQNMNDNEPGLFCCRVHSLFFFSLPSPLSPLPNS